MARSIDELNTAAEHYYFSAQQMGIDNRCRDRLIERCLPFVRRGRILELGFMDGQWTDRFLALGCNVTIVEGAVRNIEYGQKKYWERSDVTFVHSTFEAFEAVGEFNAGRLSATDFKEIETADKLP